MNIKFFHTLCPCLARALYSSPYSTIKEGVSASRFTKILHLYVCLLSSLIKTLHLYACLLLTKIRPLYAHGRLQSISVSTELSALLVVCSCSSRSLSFSLIQRPKSLLWFYLSSLPDLIPDPSTICQREDFVGFCKS